MEEIFAFVLQWLLAGQQQEVSEGLAFEQMERQEQLFYQSQAWARANRLEQNEYEQQMHEHNLVNDPLLQKQGLVGAGMSQAGAIQALAGAPSTGFSPTASNGSIGAPALPSLNQSNPNFQAFSDAIQNYFANKQTKQNIEESKSNVSLNQAQIDKWCKDIEQRGIELGIQQESIDIARMVAYSQVDLNESQINLNLTSMRRMASEIQLNFAKIENLDADTALKYVEASKVVAETGKIEAETGYYQSMTGLVESQIVGQNLQNLDQQMVNYLKSMRVEASSILHCDVDSDECTQLLTSMALGKWSTVSKILDVKTYTGNDVFSTSARLGASQGYNKHSHLDWSHGHFSPSFQSDWNHGLYFRYN